MCRIDEKEHVRVRSGPRLCRRDHGVDGLGHAHQWVSSEPRCRVCRDDTLRRPRAITAPNYGMSHFVDLFTARQLNTLATFTDLVAEARELVLEDAVAAGMVEGLRLEEGGTDAAAYADAVATYLGFAVSRLADYGSSISTWMPDPKNEGIRNTFARQAIPMTWDFAEANPLSSASGNFWFMLRGIGRTVDLLPARPSTGVARQGDAASQLRRGLLMSTDPPYYDNIPYSD